jgi:hypothetical protein
MAANDTVQLSIKGTVSGQMHVHTLHFRLMNAGINEQLLAEDWNTNLGAIYRDIFVAVDNPLQLVTGAHVCGSVPLRASAEVTPGASVGTRPNGGNFQKQPSWLASQWSVRTALSGRSRRGRNYFGGIHEGDTIGNDLVVNGTNQDTVFEKLTAYRAALLGRYGDAGAQALAARLVVHSAKLAAVAGTQCQDSSTLVNGIIIRTPVASMKSRKPGSGS